LGVLDVDSAVPFLVERGLLDVEAILSGAVSVESVARRNRNLRISVSSRSGLFVKQPDELGQSSLSTFRAEAEFYRFHSSDGSVVARVLPDLLLYEPAIPLLAVELLSDHQTLTERHRSCQQFHFPIAVWAELGERLGEIHRMLRERPPVRTRTTPLVVWLKHVHQPNPRTLSELSPARLKVLEILQASSAIANGLNSLDQWWDASSVIHGDMRADNVLVRTRGDGVPEDIRIIDWELHGIGDPVWDIAGCLEVLVEHWVISRPISEDDGVPTVAALAESPWVVLQAASRAFWLGYLATAGTDDHWAETAASKVPRFAAARMVQTALEWTTQGAALPIPAVLLLQVSENVFANPAAACSEFFALA
jgi:hypothetical protein